MEDLMPYGSQEKRGVKLTPEEIIAIGTFENKGDRNIIQIYGSDAYWEQNANYPNNYTLEKKYCVLGKTWMHDKSGIHIYGWVDEVIYGDNIGKIEAGVPVPYDEETDSDAVSLGFYESVQAAMRAVLENNNPDYGGYYI